MSLIESLPFELATDILELACLSDLEAYQDQDQVQNKKQTDGGSAVSLPLYHTARSLCLVSRTFYSLAVPLLYRNVFVAGRVQLARLAHTLKSRPELGSCTVHLVCISDRAVANSGSRLGAGSGSGEDADKDKDNDNDNNIDVDSPPKFAFWFPRSREARQVQQTRMRKWWEARVQVLTEVRASVLTIIGEFYASFPLS